MRANRTVRGSESGTMRRHRKWVPIAAAQADTVNPAAGIGLPTPEAVSMAAMVTIPVAITNIHSHIPRRRS